MRDAVQGEFVVCLFFIVQRNALRFSARCVVFIHDVNTFHLGMKEQCVERSTIGRALCELTAARL